MDPNAIPLVLIVGAAGGMFVYALFTRRPPQPTFRAPIIDTRKIRRLW